MKAKCPNCHQATISYWKKFWMAPARATECSNCQAEISIPFWILFELPVLLAVLVYTMRFSSDYKPFSPIWLFVLVVYTIISLFLNPLIVKPKDRSTGYHLKNIAIMIVYMIMFFAIWNLSTSDSNPIVGREKVPNAFEFIQYHLTQSSIVMHDNDLDESAKVIELRADRDNVSYYYDTRLINLIDEDTDMVDFKVIYTWLFKQHSETGFSEQALSFMDELKTINHNYHTIGNKNLYKVPLAPLGKIELPQLAQDYIKEVHDLLTEYHIQ